MANFLFPAKVLFLATSIQIIGFCCGQYDTSATFYTDISHPACGYGNPIGWLADAYSSSYETKGQTITTAVSSSLFQGGKGCGACYDVWCTSANRDWGGGPKGCTGKTVTVVVVDLCPAAGNQQWCGGGKTHFDMSVPAWSVIGVKRLLGYVEAKYKRVSCNPKDRSGRKLNMHVRVRDRSHQHWQSFFFYYSCGVGTLDALSVAQDGNWRKCSHDWGTGYSCQGLAINSKPLTMRITSGAGESVTFTVGAGWLNNHNIRDTGVNFKNGCSGALSGGGSGGGKRPITPHKRVMRWRKMKGRGPGMHCRSGKFARGKYRGKPCRTQRKVRHLL